MDSLRYIHAADLHLDTPFRGLSSATSQDGRLSRILRGATFAAAERLFRLCERDKPDFLVIAGDVYNEEQHSVKAQLLLRDGCQRLAAAGIPVFLAHGNHDPLSSRLSSVHWPDNVTVFGPEAEQHVVKKNGEPVAVVHGISHARVREGRNLAALLRRDPQYTCFQLGVLHCAVDGGGAADRYAPCALEDLVQTGLDAWALGHVHQRGILRTRPFIAYSGNTQGLHCNEPGPRGCLRVTVRPAPDGAYACQEEFVRLGPVQWAGVDVDVAGAERLDDVEDRLTRALEAAADATEPGCEALLARVRLVGRTPLDATLREAGACEDLAERLTYLQTGDPGMWITELRAETGRIEDRAQQLQREDLLGEALRLGRGMEGGGEALRDMADAALRPLYEHGQLRKILSRPDDARLSALLAEAERLCVDVLEAR